MQTATPACRTRQSDVRPGVPPIFIDARVQGNFPQMISRRLERGRSSDRVAPLLEVDWIQTGPEAFDELEGYLNNGDNASINDVLAPNIYDTSFRCAGRIQFIIAMGIGLSATGSRRPTRRLLLAAVPCRTAT